MTDTEYLAAALTDLADAVARYDGGDALTCVQRIDACDPGSAAALTDLLSFLGLFGPLTATDAVDEAGRCSDEP